MCQVGQIQGFDFERQKNGTFLYKAQENLLSLKSKPVYRDKPQYSILEEVESRFKLQGKQMIESIGIDIIKYLNSL